MAQPYVGEIRLFAGNFAPANWAFCDGSAVPMGEYEPLFQLIGTTYGGDGETWWALPDLRGRIPVHQGNGFAIGASGGIEEVALSVDQIPVHSHAFAAANVQGDQISPGGNVPAQSFNVKPYVNDATTGSMNGSIAPIGGNQPHTNFQPYLCVNFIISLLGIFPSPN